MLIVLLLACAPHLAARSGPPPQGPLEKPSSLQENRGKIAWFSGDYAALMAEAARSKKIVFLDFYSSTNAYTKKLERTTYCDPEVLDELKDVLCFGIDTDSRDSRTLRKRFQVLTAPALVFLDPDGTLRDQISGYFAPEPFLRELRRIRKNVDTFSDLRARISRSPDDLDARWALGRKLRELGDLPGYEEQVAQIRERDRAGRTRASRAMRLSELSTAASGTLDLEPLYQFVADEKEPGLLFEGWWDIWSLEGQAARSERDSERARMHELRWFAAARRLWPLVPVEQHGGLGNNIAWSIYESRASASRSDLEFALGVARKAVEAAPDVPAVVDTLACCLYAVGRQDEALDEVRRCIKLDPQNPEWLERLTEFQRLR